MCTARKGLWQDAGQKSRRYELRAEGVQSIELAALLGLFKPDVCQRLCQDGGWNSSVELEGTMVSGLWGYISKAHVALVTELKMSKENDRHQWSG